MLCPFLRIDPVGPRYYICTLREELGSWARVHADPGYRRLVALVLRRIGEVDCGDYPGSERTCAECGVSGDG